MQTKTIIAARMLLAGTALAALSACSQQPLNRPAQASANPPATQTNRSETMGASGNMQQMMARCERMMREGHSDMPMSPDMQKQMNDCQAMMKMHGAQPMR